MSAHAQKFEFFEKKLSLGVRSPWTAASDPSDDDTTTQNALKVSR